MPFSDLYVINGVIRVLRIKMESTALVRQCTNANVAEYFSFILCNVLLIMTNILDEDLILAEDPTTSVLQSVFGKFEL